MDIIPGIGIAQAHNPVKTETGISFLLSLLLVLATGSAILLLRRVRLQPRDTEITFTGSPSPRLRQHHQRYPDRMASSRKLESASEKLRARTIGWEVSEAAKRCDATAIR